MEAHWFDILALVTILSMAFLGAWRGLVSEIFPFLSLLGGYFAAPTLYGRVSHMLGGVVEEGLGRDAAAYGIVFIGAWALMTLVGMGAMKLSGKFELATAFNTLGGFGAGLAKACFTLSLFALALGLVPPLKKDMAKKSVSGPGFISMGDYALANLAPLLSKKMDARLKEEPAKNPEDEKFTAMPQEDSQAPGGEEYARNGQ